MGSFIRETNGNSIYNDQVEKKYNVFWGLNGLVRNLQILNIQDKNENGVYIIIGKSLKKELVEVRR